MKGCLLFFELILPDYLQVLMHNHFIKQIILLFVAPAAFFLATVSILIATEVAVPVQLSCIALMLVIWLGVAFLVIRRYSRSIRSVENALSSLHLQLPETGSGSPHPGLFSPIVDSLGKVSERMKEQQEELQMERLRRLRSVIDGQDQERQRLSRELHDGIGQSLIAVKLQLEHSGNQGQSQMRASVDVAKGMIDVTIDEVRRVTNALLPAALNEFGLSTALRARCDEMALVAGLKIHFETSGTVDRLDGKSKTYLYRIAQEAITNVIKHARASRLNVQLLREGQQVTLIVSDNGKGFIFDPAAFAHRNGIQNIRERVALLDGTFSLNTGPDAGTTLEVTIPYKTVNG